VDWESSILSHIDYQGYNLLVGSGIPPRHSVLVKGANLFHAYRNKGCFNGSSRYVVSTKIVDFNSLI
jgi:hypothetical protein